ncbi:helix-turn-helix transcriptional regulator [Actinoallomurus sp. NPDC052274]|uniref:helix-turn-helix domain-containing protein n=1 Tax=Actinoallomurus sp. NPDC052274 TaxID=3155420 RepID=UPI00341A2F84
MSADTRRLHAERIRAERKARGWDKPEMARQLARAAGDTRGSLPDHECLLTYVKRWERGVVGISERYRLLYCRAFGMSEGDLFPEPANISEEQLSSADIGKPVISETIEFAAWLEQSNVGDTTIEILRENSRLLSYEYPRRPPLDVMADAELLQRDVVAILRAGRQKISQTKMLLGVSAELLALLTLLAGDVGRYRLARAYGRTAWTCAQEADSDPARALVLIAQSKTACWENEFAEATNLAGRGLQLSPAGPQKVLLAVSKATALKSLGDLENAQCALVAADGARDEISYPDENATAWSCPRARQATYALQVHLGARNPDAMLRAAQAADAAWAYGDPWVYGTWAQVRIGAALAHVLNGDPEGAEAELAPVLEIGPSFRVATISGRLKAAERGLEDRRYRASETARTLRERIRIFRAESLDAREGLTREVR